MTEETIRIEFETTLDEFAAVHVRQVLRSKLHRRWRLGSLISGSAAIGAVSGAIGVFCVAGLLGRPVGVEVFVGVVAGGVIGAVVGGFIGALCAPLWGPLYDRSVTRQMMTVLEERYGAGMTMRCVIELRPACLWLGQEGVETAYDWNTLTAVEDTADGVELWFGSLPIVAENRAFATPSDRERFVNRARAALPASSRVSA
jgi:hypothetical protein